MDRQSRRPAQANPSVALSTIGVTHGTKSLKVTQAEDTIGDDDFVWVAVTGPNWTTGDTAFEVLRNAVNIGDEHYNLLLDVTFRQEDLADQGVNTLNVTFGLNFNGQNAGFYDALAPPTNPVTTTIPLSAFDLPDVEDQGATSYSAQIGFTADASGFPFSVYVDNIRLEQISTPDLLTLEINRSNGLGTLKNLTSNPISFDYLEIKSAGDSLDLAGWSSLDDQNATGMWIEAGGASARRWWKRRSRAVIHSMRVECFRSVFFTMKASTPRTSTSRSAARLEPLTARSTSL